MCLRRADHDPPNHRLGPADQRTLGTTKKKNNTVFSRGRNLRGSKTYLIEMSREFARRLCLQGVVTVTTGVTIGVSTGVGIGAVGAFGVSSSEKLPDACLDFCTGSAETHAAGADEPVRALPAGGRGVIEVEPDRGGRHAAPQQPRPGAKVWQVEERVGAPQSDLLGQDRCVGRARPAGNN